MNRIKRENAEKKKNQTAETPTETVKPKDVKPSATKPPEIETKTVAERPEIYKEKKTSTIPSREIKTPQGVVPKKKVVKVFGIPVLTIELL